MAKQTKKKTSRSKNSQNSNPLLSIEIYLCSEAFAESLLDLECSLEDECLKLFGDGLWQQFAQVLRYSYLYP